MFGESLCCCQTYASILRTKAFLFASSRLAVASVSETTAINDAGRMETAVATAYYERKGFSREISNRNKAPATYGSNGVIDISETG